MQTVAPSSHSQGLSQPARRLCLAPFRRQGFYLAPWVNCGREWLVGASPTLAGETYRLPALSYIVALHLGYGIGW
ncbi:MAG: hypothetical protein OHK0039_37520 [Bacteroidia bacterium]